MKSDDKIKKTVLLALNHQEAEDGLFFRNFFNMHEADERPMVDAKEEDIIEALNQLIVEKKVKLSAFDGDVVFQKN